MPQSLVRILVHVVFSTKGRADLIRSDFEAGLYAYISGIVENNGAKLFIGNGSTDHSHFLISLGRNDVSVFIGDMKRDSSLWVKQNGGPGDFYWQRGYGAFSIGESQIAAVTRYIMNQKIHHQRQDFKDEFRELCRENNVDIDERYCWD